MSGSSKHKLSHDKGGNSGIRRRGFTDPEVARRAAYNSHSLDNYVRRVVARAGELTPEHLETLRGLLPPAEIEAER